MALRVGVIGGGQLARMMIAPAVELGLELRVLAEEEGMAAGLAATAVGDYRDLDTVRAFAADVAREESVAQVMDAVVAELGAPAVLINNAGVLRDNLLFKMSAQDWDTVMDVHLRGHFLMTRAAQRHMTEQGWGRIVNISSTSALGNRGQANYAAAKAGIQGFTKSVAIELGRFGITVNAIAPGLIETDMTRATAERIGVPYETYVAKAAEQIPVARTGTPEDIAAAASFFARQEASFISGQVLYVAGGPKA